MAKESERESPAPAKLALLFLITSEPHQAEMWDEFADGPEGPPPVFVHAKQVLPLQSNIFRNAVRLPTIPTAWGDISLVRATLLLLKEALRSSDATHFSLVSESCVPIKPLREIERRLSIDGRSRIAWQDTGEMMATHRGRCAKADRIPSRWWRLHPQWITLNREAAEWVCAEDLTRRFERVFAADEHYFATVLELAGYPMKDRVSRSPSTWVRWGRQTPTRWDSVDARTAAELSDSPAFFARKFVATSDIRKWGLHLPRPEAASGGMDSPRLPAPRRRLSTTEIQVDHRFWSDSLVIRRDGEFCRLMGTCGGIMEKDPTSRILRWHSWPPERLIRYPTGPGGRWKVVSMDWSPTAPRVKTIFVSGMGGIGNQLFQLAYGLHLQRKSGARLRGDLQLLAGLEGVPDEVTGSQAPDGLASLNHCNKEESARILDGPWHDGLRLRGYFQSYDHIEGCRDALSGILGDVPKLDALGMHIRRGDYLDSGHYMDLPASYYHSGALRMIREHPGAFREIILFSDDPTWCEQELLPHLQGILPVRIFTGGAHEALREMKSTRGMIIANSTFGWWGAWLAGGPTLFPETWKIPRGEFPPGLGCTSPLWAKHTIPAEPAPQGVTVISAFFDLGAFQKGTEGVRDAEKYRSWMSNFEFIENPLIFYVETEQDYQLVTSIRSRRNFPTRVVLVDRNEMSSFRNLEKVRESIRTAEFTLASPNTTVAEYSCVQHAKYELTAHAIGEGWVESDQCCWMDCGKIFDRLRLDDQSCYRIRGYPVTGDGKVHYTLARNFLPRTLEEVQRAQGGAGAVTLAGGFFIGQTGAMSAWCDRYLKHALDYQQQGWIFTDQAAIHAMLSEGHATEIAGHPFADSWFGLCGSLMTRIDG
jgi:hypothetical protein